MNQCITHAEATHTAIAFFVSAHVALFGGIALQEIRRWLRNRAYRRSRGQH